MVERASIVGIGFGPGPARCTWRRFIMSGRFTTARELSATDEEAVAEAVAGNDDGTDTDDDNDDDG